MVRVTFAAIASLFAGASVGAAYCIPPSADVCDVTDAEPDLPEGQTEVTIPDGQVPTTVALGVGVQNYTCSDEGTYTAIGAVATLFDISCYYDYVDYSITEYAYDVWTNIPGNNLAKVEKYFKIKKRFPIFADHYFTTNPSGTGISPVFDARATSRKGDKDAYVLVAREGGIPAPTGPKDVDWLHLTKVEGKLANTVLRVDTEYGQPPSSCKPGSDPISVKYTTVYWFLE